VKRKNEKVKWKKGEISKIIVIKISLMELLILSEDLIYLYINELKSGHYNGK